MRKPAGSILVLLLAAWTCPLLAPAAPAVALFGPAGELLTAPPAGSGAAGGQEDPRDFNANVRVDDDLSPEHREPAVIRAPGGILYAAYCERAAHYNPELVMCTRSTDGGATWLAPAARVNDTAPNAVMMPAIGVLADGALALVWTEMKFAPYNYEIRFSRSEDGGMTWSPSAVVHPVNPSIDYLRPALAVADGRILAAFWQRVSGLNGRPVVVTSDDAGDHWTGPLAVTQLQGWIDGAAPCVAYNAAREAIGLVMAATNNRILYFGSTDAGASWSAAVQVNDAAASSVNYPDVACAGEHDHVVWMDNRSGDADVWIAGTTDGIVFTPSVRVNDSFGGNQYEPHIAADPLGRIHACWIWNLPFQSNIDLYYSVSEDGGANWLTPSPRVNAIPYVVQPYVAWTSDLVADPAGHAYIFWNDGRDTDYYDNVYFATNLAAAGVGDPAPGHPIEALPGCSLAILGQPGPDPLLRLSLEQGAGRMAIDLVDVSGRWIRSIAVGGVPAGEHLLRIADRAGSGSLATGTYFVRARLGGASVTRTVLVLR